MYVERKQVIVCSCFKDGVIKAKQARIFDREGGGFYPRFQ